MTEEQVTKALLHWLEEHGWEILCFDFPQSGTGVCLQPDEPVPGSKNRAMIIPDIVAWKAGAVVFFENKSRFSLADLVKVHSLRTANRYIRGIQALLNGYQVCDIHYGIGLFRSAKDLAKAMENRQMADFILSVETDREVHKDYDPKGLFR
ncbi:MAG: hypothetical protein LPK14_07755 [Hymenobacteraceae bacterium]|nr:hypothetical protein [Hymenobacteraceae bacterium]